MKREHDSITSVLDDILIEWHRYCDGYRAIADIGSSPMFNQYRCSKQYDYTADIADATLHKDRCEVVSFHVGELVPMRRTAIQIHARNLSTGRSVWTSARLPTNVEERAVLLRDARQELSQKLTNAGIL